jgi:hypothetical protein
MNWKFCVCGSRGVSGVPSQEEIVALKIILEFEGGLDFDFRRGLMKATG